MGLISHLLSQVITAESFEISLLKSAKAWIKFFFNFSFRLCFVLYLSKKFPICLYGALAVSTRYYRLAYIAYSILYIYNAFLYNLCKVYPF